MRILITNDDGIHAPGIAVLQDIAAQLGGKDSEIWTVAPANEQSGVGHCISFIKPMMVSRLGKRAFAIDGFPADCVLAGVCDIMKDAPPDVILSGVNRGNNAAQNTLYSGTIGAAMEGALHGIKSIALSQFFGPENAGLDDPFEAARHHAGAVIKTLFEGGTWADQDYGVFYNVNFPPVSAKNVLGTRAVTQGFRNNSSFGVERQKSPSNRNYLWVNGGPQHEKTAPGSDVHANLEGYTSVTPMRVDLTAHDVLAKTQELF